MSDLTQWWENNDAHLSASLAWLRLRLARLAGPASARQLTVVVKQEPPSGWFGRCRKPAEKTEYIPEKVKDADIAAAARCMDQAAGVDPPPALVVLSRCLGLSRFERDVLLLCAAMELDTRVPGFCARAQDDPSRPYPTFALAFALFDNPTWDALSADRPLRFWRLLEINQPGATPLTVSALRIDERIVNYLKGLNQLDDRLAPLLVPFDLPGDAACDLAASHEAIVEDIEHHVRRGNACRAPVVQLTGMDTISKQQIALWIISRLGCQGFRMPSESIPAAAGETETLTRLWQRESTLLPLALYLDAVDSDEGSRPAESQLNRFLARAGTLSFVDTREPRTGLGLDTLTYEVDKPLPAEQQQAWIEALEERAGDGPSQLAGQFNLSLPSIRRIAGAVLADMPSDETAEKVLERLWETCLIRTRPRLDRLAHRIEPKATWQELVLPEEPLDLLREIAAQVRQRSKVYDAWGFRSMMNRGFGISALFAGESGTGKTMAAEVIANELHLDLYRIDLSAVVSKYIGETEKNLRRVFDAAEDGGVILFFDEADALFGKRSEVKDSHDRYANIEINYLLQRMEAYRGLAVLATNMKGALDRAFLRRLRFIVTFPFPGIADRKRIWEKVFPRETPRDTLDPDCLARLNLTGGSIHNVALNAAFLAASSGTPVSMPLLLDAARTEFRKLEKPINDGDFRCMRPVEAKT